ncbi:hypothetical protein C8R43DRAFT_1010825 [Mycena crocata]|nr:hypothetical protein C8R43DRAFT_1010742 [Mycena crocata]KAJ7147434.1 hypothetical protein C8R43DRAFT_1010761 [Mycena crocata]KAJ7147437.1 hypothetical protein C8R43DRAFT_1010780 [Mycena crocata]KAJ7147441.1 hypothetical protein C8R43DRAFT_1010806 [Mycena crocata]KAJ7147444.1 hypothetical protein C8R43DRAFT_1010825 [Mycena crocata]
MFSAFNLILFIRTCLHCLHSHPFISLHLYYLLTCSFRPSAGLVFIPLENVIPPVSSPHAIPRLPAHATHFSTLLHRKSKSMTSSHRNFRHDLLATPSDRLPRRDSGSGLVSKTRPLRPLHSMQSAPSAINSTSCATNGNLNSLHRVRALGIQISRLCKSK